MNYFLVLAIIFILIFGTEKLLRKWLSVEKRRLSETPAKNLDQWGRGIILVVVLCAIPLLAIEEDARLIWFFIGYLILMNSFQAFLQWKYLKGSKEYLLTLLQLPVAIPVLLFIAFKVY